MCLGHLIVCLCCLHTSVCVFAGVWMWVCVAVSVCVVYVGQNNTTHLYLHLLRVKCVFVCVCVCVRVCGLHVCVYERTSVCLFLHVGQSSPPLWAVRVSAVEGDIISAAVSKGRPHLKWKQLSLFWLFYLFIFPGAWRTLGFFFNRLQPSCLPSNDRMLCGNIYPTQSSLLSPLSPLPPSSSPSYTLIRTISKQAHYYPGK